MTTRTLALALALLAAGAPAAGAAPKPPKKKLVRWTYAVTVKGDVTYSYASEQPAVFGSLSTTDELTFRWTSKMPRLQILDGRVLNTNLGKVKLTRVAAERHQSMPLPEGGVATGDCTGSTATAGNATLTDGHLAPLGKRKDGSLDLRPFSGVTAPVMCTGKLNGPGSIVLTDGTGNHGPFDLTFDLPEEAIGMGKVIERFDKRSYGCPAPPSQFTTKCEARMEGTITLRRKGRKVIG